MNAIHTPEWFDSKFENGGQIVPVQLRAMSERICKVFNIKGICDPMYIANIAAYELGMGNGQGQFHARKSDTDLAVDMHRLSKRLAHSYSFNIYDEDHELTCLILEGMGVEAPSLISKSVSPDVREAVREMLDHLAHSPTGEALPELSTTAMVESFPHKFGSTPGIYAIQFMAVAAAGQPAKNIATFIPSIEVNKGYRLQMQKPGGRDYWNPQAKPMVLRDTIYTCILEQHGHSELLELQAPVDADADDEWTAFRIARNHRVRELVQQHGISGLMARLSSTQRDDEPVPGPAQ